MNTSGCLYIVATPIGHLADISARAMQTLQEVDLIAAEDTRHSRALLDHYHITTKMLAYHEHNEQKQTEHLMELLKQGQSIALISDAGTPLISDPGYLFVKQAREQNIKIVPIPGACALIAALSASGLPTDRFYFAGFLPAKKGAREKQLQALKDMTCTLIFYESPHRIIESLTSIADIFSEQRRLIVARELTKKFETFYRGSVIEVRKHLADNPQQQKGEFVILIHGADELQCDDLPEHVKTILEILLKDLPLKQAVKLIADIGRIKKNKLYDWALKMKSNIP